MGCPGWFVDFVPAQGPADHQPDLHQRILGKKYLPQKVSTFWEYQICDKAAKWQNAIKYTQNHQNTLKIH